MLVIVLGVPVTKDTFDAVALTYSPTLPASALLFVVVPIMPAVCDVVNELLKTKDVPVPAPIAVLVTLQTVHAIVSTMSFRAAATLRTTVVPVEAV
jgi:hypothetical protein